MKDEHVKTEDEIWENFVEAVRVDAKVPELVNFLGSVKKFEKLFRESMTVPANMLGKEE